jgi:hypothetical protein
LLVILLIPSCQASLFQDSAAFKKAAGAIDPAGDEMRPFQLLGNFNNLSA